MNILLRFRHGLGDCIQFTSVLRHLREYREEINYFVECGADKFPLFEGLAQQFQKEGKVKFKKTIDIHWHENRENASHWPSSKVEKCLREVFGMTPDTELLRYQVNVPDSYLKRAESYLQGVRPFFIHYEGNTSSDKKNLNQDVIVGTCLYAKKLGYTPILFDWDRRSPLPRYGLVTCPDASHLLWDGTGTGNGMMIAALLKVAEKTGAFLAIDSGPGHIAPVCDIQTLVVWPGHHPINYYCPSPNVRHLVLHGMRSSHNQYFQDNYDHQYISRGEMLPSIVEWLRNMNNAPKFDSALVDVGYVNVRRTNMEQDMVIVRDVGYEDCYKLAIIPGVVAHAKTVVDIGAHIGVFATKLHSLNPNAKISCVEVCPENQEALNANVSKFAKVYQGACTYDKRTLMLLNAVRDNCESTGGSIVVPVDGERMKQEGYVYWEDERPIRKITLEEIMQDMGSETIDILKLDCEGAEFSILGETPSLDKIKFIVGEYHDKARWDVLLRERFRDWDYGQMYTSSNGLGLFHLRNRKY